ncbi:hypothetical protein GFK82_00640 [Candidatus Steffania adelgidicola]|nr:hypothetical protein GFK82_00640 [Candidatus Steffania adelgidicola]
MVDSRYHGYQILKTLKISIELNWESVALICYK